MTLEEAMGRLSKGTSLSDHKNQSHMTRVTMFPLESDANSLSKAQVIELMKQCAGRMGSGSLGGSGEGGRYNVSLSVLRF